jgi:hypothetical protein
MQVITSFSFMVGLVCTLNLYLLLNELVQFSCSVGQQYRAWSD